jgi:cyclophilin family peptidyl-prolyl cis-trans isomerase
MKVLRLFAIFLAPVIALAALPVLSRAANFDTGTPLTGQTLAPGQTSVLDLSKHFIDPATTNGTLVTFNTSQGSFGVTLFDKDAPQTVTNFLDYIEAGAYTNDAFHRLSNLSQTGPAQPPPTPYQLLQAGGFGVNTDSATPANVTGFSTVPTFQPIQNESNDSLHSNVIGTLAMARGSDPNSATSQFFFNLVDNSQALAASNGTGFTVFGTVTDSSGSTVLQNFASNYTPTDVTTATGNSSFFAFPLINGFTPASNFPTGATTNALAIINSINVAIPPSGALTYSILSNSNPSVVTATLGSNTLGSGLSANQLQLVAAQILGSSIITLQIIDKAGEAITQQFSVTVGAVSPLQVTPIPTLGSTMLVLLVMLLALGGMAVAADRKG